METSNILSSCAILISIVALKQSFVAHKATVISEIKKELSDRAIDCNKFINPNTQACTDINQEVSAIVTSIIYAKQQLEIQYRNHQLLLLNYDQKDFIRYFYFQLHSSIIEMLKNSLRISNYDPHTTPTIEDQHKKCKKFLQSVIEERI